MQKPVQGHGIKNLIGIIKILTKKLDNISRPSSRLAAKVICLDKITFTVYRTTVYFIFFKMKY